MFNKKLDLAPPRLKEAFQLSFVLIFTIVAMLTPMNILSGQIQNFGEFMPIVTGFFSAVILSIIPYSVIRFATGRPHVVGVPLIIAGLTVAALVMTAVDSGWFYILRGFFPEIRLPAFTLANLTVVASFYWIQYACVTALLLVAGAARRIRIRETELARSQNLTLEAQLNMLRMQLNPHFMCNSLNVISSLIIGRRHNEAQRMADKLAEFLRASSEIEGLETELGDELDLIDSYLEVEAARFGDRLHIEMVHDERVEHALVPNFILQPLVENALKYGVQYSRGPVEIRIFSRCDGDRLILIVENEAMEMLTDASVVKGGGIGLANVRARLDLIFGANATFEGVPLRNGYRATINLPFRTGSADGPAASLPIAVFQ